MKKHVALIAMLLTAALCACSPTLPATATPLPTGLPAITSQPQLPQPSPTPLTAAAPALPPSTPSAPALPPSTPSVPAADDPDPMPSGVSDGEPDPNETPVPHRTLAEYQKVNPEVVGWLKIPNTRIDYPIARGADNEFYLGNNVEKKKSKAGALFMDYRNAYFDQRLNLIIYGHNMRDGSMFHDLRNYKEEKFFKQNREISLFIDGLEQEYEVFAAFVVQVKKTRFITTRFDSVDTLASYANGLAKLSKFTAGSAFTSDDRLLTLSTCTYEYDDSRFVVLAKLKRG